MFDDPTTTADLLMCARDPGWIWVDRSLDAAMERANTQAPSGRKREAEPASLRGSR